MAEELENKQEPVYGQDERGREANSSESQGNSEQKDYRSSRPQRPRIHSQRAYSSDRSNQGGEGGFRPEGFGAGLQGAQGGQYQGGYRPRNNYQGGYQQRQQGGYQPRQRQQGGTSSPVLMWSRSWGMRRNSRFSRRTTSPAAKPAMRPPQNPLGIQLSLVAVVMPVWAR